MTKHHIKRIFSALSVLTLCLAAAAQETIVRVSDFGAVPNDGKNDLKQIRKALRKAEKIGATKIVFDAGTYDIFHSDIEENDALVLSHTPNVTMEGAVDADGEPATMLLRHYEMAPDLKAKNLLRIDECENFTLRNMKFDNSPRYMTSGEVVFNDGKHVVVRIFDGCSLVDGTRLYCANLWDMKTRNLKHTGSVTFGGSVSKKAAEYTTRVTNWDERKVLISSTDAASKIEVGDGISWHFGWNGTQVDFWKCDNMRMENVHSYSAIGFHFQSSLCRNLSGYRVRIGREGDDLNCGSRDAWKMWLCMGEATMNAIHMDGVRWDGQNVHGKFLYFVDAEGPNTATFSYNGMSVERVEPGDRIGMWKDRENESLMTVKSYEVLPIEWGKPRLVRVSFEEPLPDFLCASTPCNPYSHTCHYTLENSTFENIAGCASILRNDDSTIRGCTFAHIMYPAVFLGGDLNNESVTGKNLLVEGCEFEDCAWESRNGVKGAFAAAVLPFKDFPVPYIFDLRIVGNTFRDCSTAISVKGVKGIMLKDNKFENVEVPFLHNDSDGIVSDIQNQSE